jgi:hypothetical protein
MATFTLPKTKQIIQIHPRVLKEDRNCCECTYYEPNSSESNTPANGECEVMDRVVGAYDECSSFNRRKEGDTK